MKGVERRSVAANGRTFSVLTAGDTGPLVLLCHGFPELAFSWRHQLPVLAQAGYRVCAPDMRGYGTTGGPLQLECYSIFDLVGDLVGLVKALAAKNAIIIGHDWGAGVAWQAAMMRPDIFTAVCGMSVPFQPRRGDEPPSQAYRGHEAKAGYRESYIHRFQEPGRAESELEADIDRTMRAIFGSSEDPSADEWRLMVAPGEPILLKRRPHSLPDWITQPDFQIFVDAFSETGFSRPLNWYRNIDRNWALSAPWQGASIRQPAMFIVGSDDPVRKMPGFSGSRLADQLGDLRRSVIIEGAGHWLQQEMPERINAELLGFLEGL